MTENYTPIKDESPSEALARELGDNADSDLGFALLRHVKRWEQTKNPHWIDLAVVIVTEAGRPIPPCLQIMASHIAMRRINGMEALAGGAAAIMEEIKGQAYACMAFLIGNGVTAAEAAKHAANATAAVFGKPFYKASTLERDYGKHRKGEHGQWEVMFKGTGSGNDETFQLLMKHLETIPDLDPGNRRQ